MESLELHGKLPGCFRLATFNVNGIRTLFGHYPFSRMNNMLGEVFRLFEADIITFQELKLDRRALQLWGKVENYWSFISLPAKKRGYSGVGCWVRIPEDHEPNGWMLKVIKAEEGITGILKIKGSNSISYSGDPLVGIGGYEDLPFTDEKEAEDIDNEGICIIIELACNIVVISTYCPANSIGTEEGEAFRLKFLNVLFKRIINLHKPGKEVILMGDINIARDLIDHAESLKENNIFFKSLKDGERIDHTFAREASSFIFNRERKGRLILNQNLADSLDPFLADGGILIDAVRLIQGRARLKMYTVWNTKNNSRPANYGSRIDYILATKGIQKYIKNADIWPQVMGSDHCPVFTDIRLIGGNDKVEISMKPIPRFEARYMYNLNQPSITDLFTKTNRPHTLKQERVCQNKNKVLKRGVKKQRDVTYFFNHNSKIEDIK